MKQLLGFIPKNSRNELHLRVKNLTGDVVAIENSTVSVDFFIIVKGKVEILRVDYPLEQCSDYFVKAATRKNGLTFHDFCNELIGYDVYFKNSIVPRWQLFWSGLNVTDILNGITRFRAEKKPKLSV